MKAIHLARLYILFFCTIACAGRDSAESPDDINVKDSIPASSGAITDTFPAGKVIKHVFCKSDPAQSYALYIPAKGNKEALPVVYFFDPHGDGAFALGKYTALADSYNFILIGSNNSKNGNSWPITDNIWDALFSDSQKRLRLNTNRIYACGFSGGAKVAGYIGLSHSEIKGVIANGAGLPDAAEADNFNFTFTAVAGYGDMNMTDLVEINNLLDKTRTRHRIIFFDGKHEWAPQNTMNIAFASLEMDAMREKLIPQSDSFINKYIEGSKQRIDHYLLANDYVKAQTECYLSMNLFDGLTNAVDWFKEKNTFLKNNPVYQKQLQMQQNLLSTEQNLKRSYGEKFQQNDVKYWITTITGLQAKAKGQTAEGAMYQRLLAYLSLAFYSISNQLVNEKRNQEAAYFVGLYKMADAANSEAWYLSAIINARNNEAKAAKDDLLKAVACGFADKNRIMQQAEFKNLATQINLAEIESKIK